MKPQSTESVILVRHERGTSPHCLPITEDILWGMLDEVAPPISEHSGMRMAASASLSQVRSASFKIFSWPSFAYLPGSGPHIREHTLLILLVNSYADCPSLVFLTSLLWLLGITSQHTTCTQMLDLGWLLGGLNSWMP